MSLVPYHWATPLRSLVVLFHDSVVKERRLAARGAASGAAPADGELEGPGDERPGTREGREPTQKRLAGRSGDLLLRAERLAAVTAASRTLTDSVVVFSIRARRQRLRQPHHKRACVNRAADWAAENRLRFEVRSREDMTAPETRTLKHAAGQAPGAARGDNDFKHLNAEPGPPLARIVALDLGP